MNRQDVEMLNNALQTLGQGQLQRRQLQFENQQAIQRNALEAQMRDLTEKRYEAYAGHNQVMEDRLGIANDNNAERNRILAQSEADKTRIQEQGVKAAQDFAEARDGMTEFTQTLRANRLANQQDPTKGLSQADAIKTFQTAMDGLPQQLHDQMLTNPQYSSLYKGTVDFGSIPAIDAKGNPVQPTTAPQLQTLKDPNNPGASATGVEDSHGNWHPTAAPTPGLDPNRDKLIADSIKDSLPANNSPTNAPYAAGQYDLLTKPPGAATAPTSGPAAPAQPPQAHIDFLRAHPDAAGDFDAKYGAGASKQYLQPQTNSQNQPVPGGGGLPMNLPPAPQY